MAYKILHLPTGQYIPKSISRETEGYLFGNIDTVCVCTSKEIAEVVVEEVMDYYNGWLNMKMLSCHFEIMEIEDGEI